MAAVTAVLLRDLARKRVLLAGGRGFVRFLSEGALLVTDAGGRCADEQQKAALVKSIVSAGFLCEERDRLLLLTPGDALLSGLCPDDRQMIIDWASPLHPVMELAARWADMPDCPLTDAGRQLALDALRITWQGQEQALHGLHALRAHAAVMLRAGDRSGMRIAAAILCDFCRKNLNS